MKKNKEKKKQKLSTVFKNIKFALGVVHRASPGFLAITLLCNMLSGFRNALMNVLILRYVVNAVQNGDTPASIFAVVAGCFILQLVLNVFINLFSPWGNGSPYTQRQYVKIETAINKMMMKKAREVDISAYENPEEYDRYFKAYTEGYSRVIDIFHSVSSLGFSVTNLAATAGVIAVIDPFLLVFAALPCISSFLFKKQEDLEYAAELEKKKCRRARDYTQRTFYLVDFVKEMRMGGFAELMKRRFGEHIATHTEIINRYEARRSFLRCAAKFFQNIALNFGAVAYAVYGALVSGKILYGDCLVVINSITNIGWGIISITEEINLFYSNSLYIEDVRVFLAVEPTIKTLDGAKPLSDGDLEFRNVSFTYSGAEKPTVKNLSFTLHRGEKIALVGQNGAGKTTLAKLMLRLYDVSGGEILYGGVNIKELPLFEYRDAFAVVFQDFKNFSTSIKENVLLRPLYEGEERAVKAALEKSGFGEKLARLPQGIDTRLTREFDEKGENLSGGESQKLSIARIFAKNSNIALLDEPTSALDPIAEYKMYENMMEACRDKSVIFISHRLSSAVLADRVIMLEDGELCEVGSHAELMAKNGKYAEMFKLQASKYRESEESGDEE